MLANLSGIQAKSQATLSVPAQKSPALCGNCWAGVGADLLPRNSRSHSAPEGQDEDGAVVSEPALGTQTYRSSKLTVTGSNPDQPLPVQL